MTRTRNQWRALLLGIAGLALLTPPPLAAQPVLTLKGHTGFISGVAFSPDGKSLVSGSWDKTVRVWNATTGQPVLTLKGHLGTVWSVCFSPDGRRLASACLDHTVKVWDSATGQEV